MDTAQFFDIQTLTFDPELQVRVRINDEQVAQYAECMATEEEMKAFPPVEIFYDGVKYWLADGHHRRAAEDRRRALEIGLRRWPGKSNRVIAEAIGCSRDTVRRQRDEPSGGANAPPEKREGKDGKSYSSKQKTKKQVAEKETSPSEPEAPPVETEPEVNDDYYPPLSQPIPEKYSQFVQTVKLQNIPLNDPERLIACLFDLFERPYREKLVLDLLAQMEIDDGKKTVRRILSKLNKKYPN